MMQRICQVRRALDIDKSIQTGELKAWVCLIHDRPSRGPFAAPQPGMERIRCAQTVEVGSGGNGSRIRYGQFPARLDHFASCQFVSQLFGELLCRNVAAGFYIEQVWRQTTELIPSHDVVRCGPEPLLN